eukprot:g70757.t1
MTPNPYDPCVFMKIDPQTKLTAMATTHVDDYMLAPPSPAFSDWFWGKLKERQGTITVNKTTCEILGREVTQWVDDDGRFHTLVTCREYILNLRTKHPREDGKAWVPVGTQWPPSQGERRQDSELSKYEPPRICGDLSWVRSVLWETVGPLSRLAEFQSKPDLFDFRAAEWLLCYVLCQGQLYLQVPLLPGKDVSITPNTVAELSMNLVSASLVEVDAAPRPRLEVPLTRVRSVTKTDDTPIAVRYIVTQSAS